MASERHVALCESVEDNDCHFCGEPVHAEIHFESHEVCAECGGTAPRSRCQFCNNGLRLVPQPPHRCAPGSACSETHG